jgi:small subunit ribosomal protein S6
MTSWYGGLGDHNWVLIRRMAERRMGMRYYETLYIINPNLADEDYREVVTKFNNLVEKNKGVLIKVDEWGKKTLAYSIKKFDKGYYVLMQYCGDSGITGELGNDLKLDDKILKFQTIKLSDNEDPDALKAAIEESRPKTGEDLEPTKEVGSEEVGHTKTNEEGANGVHES